MQWIVYVQHKTNVFYQVHIINVYMLLFNNDFINNK